MSDCIHYECTVCEKEISQDESCSMGGGDDDHPECCGKYMKRLGFMSSNGKYNNWPFDK
jgi:hypothetical protein